MRHDLTPDDYYDLAATAFAWWNIRDGESAGWEFLQRQSAQSTCAGLAYIAKCPFRNFLNRVNRLDSMEVT